eukprot:GFYU01017087.1.p1 GENE.GFYU01017087.1~~GFYU01017087.1.p1  ORF type:complete len:222 (+),score=34.51 GFYU01017087.1:101-766(+)
MSTNNVLKWEDTTCSFCVGDTSYQVTPLHDASQHSEQAAHLLNQQWSRTLEARLQSLKRPTSCAEKDLPISYVLLEEGVSTESSKSGSSDSVHVVGYCRIDLADGLPNSAVLTSMLVSASLRGKGLGKQMMQAVELHAKMKCDITTFYLSTKDQQVFYEKCGYLPHDTPVSSLGQGRQFISNTQLSGLQAMLAKKAAQAQSESEPVTSGSSSNESWFRKVL